MLGLADSVNFVRDSLGPACLERDADIRFINIHFLQVYGSSTRKNLGKY